MGVPRGGVGGGEVRHASSFANEFGIKLLSNYAYELIFVKNVLPLSMVVPSKYTGCTPGQLGVGFLRVLLRVLLRVVAIAQVHTQCTGHIRG